MPAGRAGEWRAEGEALCMLVRTGGGKRYGSSSAGSGIDTVRLFICTTRATLSQKLLSLATHFTPSFTMASAQPLN